MSTIKLQERLYRLKVPGSLNSFQALRELARVENALEEEKASALAGQASKDRSRRVGSLGRKATELRERLKGTI